MSVPELFNQCLELEEIRRTRMYTDFRPFALSRLKNKYHIEENKIDESIENKMQPKDRFLVSIDLVLRDLFENVRSRQLIKQKVYEESIKTTISPLAVNSYHRWHTHELIVLFDRLERILGLLQLGYGKHDALSSFDERLLSFFPVVVFEKRIHNQHNLYLGAPGGHGGSSFFLDKNEYELKKDSYIVSAKNSLKEFRDAEENISAFLENFLDDVYDYMMPRGIYAEPALLKESFRVDQKVERRTRNKHSHKEIFNQYNP